MRGLDVTSITTCDGQTRGSTTFIRRCGNTIVRSDGSRGVDATRAAVPRRVTT